MEQSTKKPAGEDKEHKKNWREEYATMEEIKAFLSDHVYLRYNMVNQTVLVFIGEQGLYKTTWFNHLLPPELRIDNPREHPFDYEAIYAEAYALYLQGFRYYFTKDEEEVLKAHNKAFETPHPEQEAIISCFRLPNEQERGEFYTATDILGKISYNPALKLTIENIGSAMQALGFKPYRSNGRRGYRVVEYKPEEIQMNRHRLACDATLDDDDRVSRDT